MNDVKITEILEELSELKSKLKISEDLGFKIKIDDNLNLLNNFKIQKDGRRSKK